MNILLVGAGRETTRLNLALSENNHSVQAQMGNLVVPHLEMFTAKLVIVVSPEASVSADTLVQAVKQGRVVFLVAGASDGLAAWGAATGIPTYSYPLSGVDLDSLLAKVKTTEAGGFSVDDNYRKVVLGGDIAARIQGQMNARRIVVTSPKGGTGKTTVAVNLAVALALSGVTTYLVDADANAGALMYHLRMTSMNQTLISLLRTRIDAASRPENMDVMSSIAEAGAYLNAFTIIDNLPTLRVLPGMVTDDLGDAALSNEQVIRDTIVGLYNVGMASGGVVIMDVGINFSHPVHRAALREAEAIAIVIKPEIPDLAETRRWLSLLISSMAAKNGRAAASEFFGSRAKICYNMVLGEEFNKAHKLLQQSLDEDNIGIKLVPNGVLPVVDSRIAAHAVNSDNREDILIWRYRNEKLEELRDFAESLLAFAAHFVPAVNEGAARAGLTAGSKKKKGWW